jgi:SAM-dependent methyltransferase
VANGKLWTPGLRRDHATRSAGSNADSPRLPNHPVELFRQHTWDAPAMKNNSSLTGEFDKYAADYDRALAEGLSISGEDKHYFAQGRIAWLAGCLRQLLEQPGSAVDFGCGTGSATPYLFDIIGVKSVIGLDVSAKLLDAAKRTYGSEDTQFLLFEEYQPSEQIDLVFCNGVFHHIPFSDRDAVVNYIYRILRPGGVLALWENNPWNPGTRYVMSRIPFDRDAITLTAPETRRLLSAGGFEIMRTDFLFIFPRLFSWFRSIESSVVQLPLGAQYQVLCRRNTH